MNTFNFYKKIVVCFLTTSLLIIGSFLYINIQLLYAQQPTSGCQIINATLNPSTKPGEYAENFYSEERRPEVTIFITTKNCAEKEVMVDLVQEKTFGDVPIIIKKQNGQQVLTGKFIVPNEEKFKINLIAGETHCGSGSVGDGTGSSGGATISGADCTYYILATPVDNPEGFFNSRDKLDGNLDYECDASFICSNEWKYLGDTSKKTTGGVILEDGEVFGSVSEACIDQGEGCYELYQGLADALGNKLETINVSSDDSIGGFLNITIMFATGIAGIIVVGRIFYLGFKYIGIRNESNATKLSDVKNEGLKAFLGLILLLTIYIILRTINPDLLNLTPQFDSVRFETGGDPLTSPPQQTSQSSQTFKQFATSNDITCPEKGGASAIPTIAKSFTDKITYSQDLRGKTCANNTFCLDCSLFVHTVYFCAGLPSPGSTTAGIFPSSEKVINLTKTSVNGIPLKPGDLLGWMSNKVPGGSEKNGHVIMYLGNGESIEVTSGSGGKKPGKAVQIRSLDSYGKRIKYIKRI